MKFYWRKEPHWINLVALVPPEEVVINHPALNKPVRSITDSDIANAIMSAFPGADLPDCEELLADLVARRYGSVLTFEQMTPQRFVLFHTDLERDPGPDEIDMMGITARDASEAEALAEKAGLTNDMALYCIWPIDRLIATLRGRLQESDDEFNLEYAQALAANNGGSSDTESSDDEESDEDDK